jgi:hypothetical protein
VTLYGLPGSTQGGPSTLTLSSPNGAHAALRAVATDDGVITESEPGCLTGYHDRIAGAIDRLVSLHDIEALDPGRRMATKAEPGDKAAS